MHSKYNLIGSALRNEVTCGDVYFKKQQGGYIPKEEIVNLMKFRAHNPDPTRNQNPRHQYDIWLKKAIKLSGQTPMFIDTTGQTENTNVESTLNMFVKFMP